MAQTTKFILTLDSKGMRRSLEKTEKSAKGVDDALDSTRKSTSRMSGAWRKFGQVVAGIAVGELIRRGLSRAIRKGKEFEQQLADLSAITGIQGDALDSLGSQALEVSKEFGESASNIIEAQKLVASQLAEKIDFGTEQGLQQLKEITEQSITLQKAAGIDLKTAVQASTTAINQFNLEASEAPRITNTMAAAAKFGAAEVGDQARALTDAGVAASSANVSFEETSAAIQILAQNGIRGARAGTGLRNIFTILTAESQKLEEQGLKPVNLQQQSLSEGLQQLKPLLKDDSALLEIFGRENINAAKALIQNGEATGEFTEKITGTNTAAEQAAVQMNTFEGASARLAATFDAELIRSFQESNGLMVTLINSTSSLIEQFAGGIRVINGWVEGNQELRRELKLNEQQTRSRAKALQENIDLFEKRLEQGDLTTEQERKVRDALKDTRQELDEMSSLLDARQAKLQGLVDAEKAHLEELREQNSIVHNNSAEIRNSENRLERLGLKLKSVETRQKSYKEATQETTEAQKNQSDATEDQTQKQSNLASEISDTEKKLEKLVNKKQGKFKEADQQEINRLQTKLDKLEAIKEERLKEAQQISKINEMQRNQGALDILGEESEDAPMSGDTQLGSLGQQGEQQSEKERQKQRELELTNQLRKATKGLEQDERSLTQIATQGSKEANKAKQQELSTTEQLGVVAAEAAASSIARGETVAETIRGVLKALLAEVVALQVRNVLSTVPFPLNVAVAGAAAAAAKGLFEAVVPEFQEGGVVSGAIGQSGMTTRGKKVISINEDSRPEFIMNAESTRRALPLLEAMNDSPQLAGIMGQQVSGSFQKGGVASGGGMDLSQMTSAIVNAINNATFTVNISANRIDEELGDFNELKNRVGN